MRDQRRARPLVDRLASFRGAPFKPFHRTGDESMVIGSRIFALSSLSDPVQRHIPLLVAPFRGR
jgi:hypothetical protein